MSHFPLAIHLRYDFVHSQLKDQQTSGFAFQLLTIRVLNNVDKNHFKSLLGFFLYKCESCLVVFI